MPIGCTVSPPPRGSCSFAMGLVSLVGQFGGPGCRPGPPNFVPYQGTVHLGRAGPSGCTFWASVDNSRMDTDRSAARINPLPIFRDHRHNAACLDPSSRGRPAPSMSKPNFPCPICTAPTHIGGWNASSGTPSPNGGTWRKREGGYLARSRYCTGGEHHVFETREQAMPSANLTELKVHPRDAVHHDQDKLYDPKAFRLDLKRVLNGVLTTDQRRTLAQGTEQILVRALREGGVSRKKGPITPDAIVAATTDCLQQMADSPLHSASERREFRRAHILYVLARGVPTRDNSTSALTAESARMTKPSEVMAWIESAYGYRLKKDRRPPSPTGVGPRVDKWHPLRADAAPQPKTVIFLVRSGPLAPEHVQDVSAPSGERDAGLEMRYIARPYDHNRLEMSVRRALAGTGTDLRVEGAAGECHGELPSDSSASRGEWLRVSRANPASCPDGRPRSVVRPWSEGGL